MLGPFLIEALPGIGCTRRNQYDVDFDQIRHFIMRVTADRVDSNQAVLSRLTLVLISTIIVRTNLEI